MYVSITIILAIISILLFLYILFMKWRSRHSKPRFAFYTVATLFALSIAIIGCLTSIDWIDLVSNLLSLMGVHIVSDYSSSGLFLKLVEKLVVGGIGVVALVSIWRFSAHALTAWEGPLTLNTVNLAELGRANDMFALAFAEMSTKLAKKSDPIVDRRLADWKQVISPAPEAVEFRELARRAFLNHLPEAALEAGGWRQQSSAWLGIIHGPRMGESSDLVVLTFSTKPSLTELSNRLELLQPNCKCHVYAVVEDPVSDSPVTELANGHTVQIWGYPNLVRAGLPLQAYARQLIKQFTQLTVGGTQATLADTYVPARVLGVKGSGEYIADVLRRWLGEPGRRHLAITGEYGQGKSTAMLEFCVDWARRLQNGEAENERVPLLIELRGKSPGEVGPTEFLAQWGARYGFQAEKLFALIMSGQVILIFEGFDELKNAGRQFERHEHFNALWRFAYPGTKIIFTGRPNFFIDQSERNSTLRIDENAGAASNAYTEMYAIQMFEKEDVLQACRAYPDDVRRGIHKTYDEHPDFREIVVRPSMLPVVATIWPEIQAAEEAGESITGSMLLERYLSAVYARKEAEVENDRSTYQTPALGSYLLLPRAFREALTLAVVWEMAISDLRNTIARSHFDQVIGRAFDNILRAMQSTEVRSPVLEDVKRLASQINSDNRDEFLEKVCTDVASAGLFVPDPVGGPSNLRFPHKQYFEYLIANLAWVQLAMPESDVLRSVVSGASRVSPIMLWKSEAIFPFNRILGKNLRCFYKSKYTIELFVYFSAAISFISETLLRIAQTQLKVIRILRSYIYSPEFNEDITIDRGVDRSTEERKFFSYYLNNTKLTFIAIAIFASAIFSIAYTVISVSLVKKDFFIWTF